MSGHSLPLNLQKALENKFFHIDDPGSAGTFDLDGKGHGLCEVVTAGAESRTLPAVGGVEVGNRLTVFFKTDGGDLTITGSDQTIVLTATGQFVTFVVAFTTVKVWRVAEDSRVAFTDIAGVLVDVQGSFVHQIPVPAWRIWNSLDAQLTATGNADDLGHVVGTYLTDDGYLTTSSQTPGDATPVVSYARLIVRVPDNYQDASAITLRIGWTRPDAAATSMALDAEVVRLGAPTVDINSTAAVDINGAASGTANFVLTPTNVVAGELLNIRINITAVSNGASYEGRILNTSFVHTV
jgi:hypothetical protein